VLAYLVDHVGQVVSRDDLRQAIWDHATFVEFDQGLNCCIGRTPADVAKNGPSQTK